MVSRNPRAGRVSRARAFACPLVLVLFGLSFSASVHALELSYEFDGTLDDSAGLHPGTNYVQADLLSSAEGPYSNYVNDRPDFGSDGEADFVRLGPQDYIGFDPGIPEAWDIDAPIRIQVRFKFDTEDGWQRNRPILTTSSNELGALGFTLHVSADGPDAYVLNLLVADGSSFLSGVDDSERSRGVFFRLRRVDPDQWIEVDLTLRLDRSGEERIIAFLDGTPVLTGYPLRLAKPPRGAFVDETQIPLDLDRIRAFLGGDASPELLDASMGLVSNEDRVGLPGPSLFVGGHPVIYDPYGEVSLTIDRLQIESPVTAASLAEVDDLLEDFTDHVSGRRTQSDAALLDGGTAVVQRLGILGSPTDWPAIEQSSLAFLDAFSEARGLIFPTRDLREPGFFDPPELLAYFLQQWILDNRFQGQLDESQARMAFPDHEAFPGPVRDAAARVSGSVDVDATYRTDPGVFLTDQETVLRPTGYYAAPGEPITITVPPAAVGVAIKVRVGIQRADMEAGGWNVLNRFPRISSRYDITDETIVVANPFGGGVYFEVADGTELGVIPVEIDGAVKMPMFSTLDLAGHADDRAAFVAATEAWDVPFFELHGRMFSATLLANEARLYPDPLALIDLMDDAFDAINAMAGRPLDGFRAEWLAYDRWVTVAGTALTASYPIFPDRDSGQVGTFLDRPNHYASPALLLDPDFFSEDREDPLFFERLYNYILWHEWGHVLNLPTLGFQEYEANVHLLANVVYNQVLGADIDTALAWSGFQRFDRDQAALDTMFSPNWQNGDRLSEGEMIYGIWDNEIRYQTRGWARFTEIAALYGWEAVGAIHGAFYARGVQDGRPILGPSDDDFIETGSAALGLDLSPIFDFWGIPPSPAARQRLRQYPPPAGFAERLLHYRSIAPRTAADFQQIYDTHALTNGGEVMIRMDYYLENFDAEMAEVILARIDGVFCAYYAGAVAAEGSALEQPDCTRFAVPADVSGPWFTDGEGGHGWFIEQLGPTAAKGVGPDRINAYWYVYLEGEPVWLIAQGELIEGIAVLDVLSTRGGQFPPDFDPAQVALEPWGELVFEFTAEGQGVATWESMDGRFGSHSQAITQLAAIDDDPAACGSGSYYNVDQSGHGFAAQVLEVQGEPQLLLAWYAYLNGEQVWLLGQAPLVDGRAELSMSSYAGADFPPRFDSADVSASPWGTIEFRFGDGEGAEVSWVATQAGFSDGELSLSRLTTLSGHECAAR